MVVMIMRAATVSGTLTLSLYLLSPFPGFCHVTPPNHQQSGVSGAAKCNLKEEKRLP